VEILRGIAQRRARTALAIGALVVGMCVLALTGALAEHFSAQFAGGVAYFSSNIQVSDDAGGYAGVVSLSKIDAIQKVPGVQAAIPNIAVPAKPGAASTTLLGLPDTIVYADPRERTYSKLKTSIARGRQLEATRQGEVVLGVDIASELNAKVGDVIDLPIKPKNPNPDFVSHSFKVVGILKRTDTLPDATAAVGLLDAQTLLQESLPASFRDRVDPSSLATGITVYAKAGTDLDRLADRINSTVPGVAATRPSEFVRRFDQSRQFIVIAAVASVLSLVFAGVFMINAMLAKVSERTDEIGLKMVFGARSWQLTAEYMLEAILLALLGGMAGLVLGAGLSALMDLSGRSVGMDIFLMTDRLAKIAVGLSAAIGIAAGFAASLRVVCVDPDLAMRAL
jgi:ABC-type antimicrobial peptide transport system permease subunit